MTWEEVQKLRKQGQCIEARDLALRELESDPGDFRLQTQLCWAYYCIVKRLVSHMTERLKASQPVDSRDVNTLVGELRGFAKYGKRRPDSACSNIAREISKVASHVPVLPGFVRWVRIDGLAVEDWDYQKRDGREYQPLAMGVARGLAKWVKASPDASVEDVDLALQWLERIRPVAQGDDALWLDWDSVLMLRRQGNYARAAVALASVLKAKRTEFWVWAEAARLYMTEDSDLALACFCRALECSADPKYAVGVHRELAELLVEQENFAQASSEIATAVALRQQEGWSMGKELEALIACPWYDPTAANAENAKAFYARYSADALVLCFDSVETKAATYLGLMHPHTPKEPRPDWKPRPIPRFAMFDKAGTALSLLGPGLRNLRYKAGDPLTVVVGQQEGDSRITIVQVSPRPDGAPWDCTQMGSGVVVREAVGDKSAKVFIGRDKDDIHISEDAWLGTAPAQLGEGVRFRMVQNPKNGRKDAFAFEPGPLPEHDVKRVQDQLRRSEKGHAFVGDAFVSPPVVDTVDTTVREVTALLVHAKHPTKDEYSWRAIKLTAV